MKSYSLDQIKNYKDFDPTEQFVRLSDLKVLATDEYLPCPNCRSFVCGGCGNASLPPQKVEDDRLKKFADMIWEMRWHDSPDADKAFGLAAEVRRGNYQAIDAVMNQPNERK